MIKNIIHHLIDKATAATRRKSPLGKRCEVPHAVHGIDPALLEKSAVTVVTTLQDAGYEAYIVGGAVRDLLLGLRPKDFDVATSATPEQVKRLFRRAFIIGRRFRIVHVVFGRGRESDVIEVSTFRALLDAADAVAIKGNERSSRRHLEGMTHAVDASGRVLRDNVWGRQEEDAARRDFSINAMYYDPRAQLVIDYHKGMQDSKKRVLRMIGDAATRYREDPVRIIRAVRFCAKLQNKGFSLSAATARPLRSCLPLLAQVPPSRLFDETLKLLQTGHAQASVQQLRALGLDQGIYPLLDLIMQRADLPLVHNVLRDTDRRVAQGKPVSANFLLACVLWPDVLQDWNARLAAGENSIPALHAAMDGVFGHRVGDIAGRGRLAADLREIWAIQPRLEKRTLAGVRTLMEQPRFRAAFDLLCLRAEIGEADEALAHWWQQYQDGDEYVRRDLLDQARIEQRRSREPKPRPAARSGAAQATRQDTRQDSQPAIPPDGEVASAPKRRRRRKRPSSAPQTDAPRAEEAQG